MKKRKCLLEILILIFFGFLANACREPSINAVRRDLPPNVAGKEAALEEIKWFRDRLEIDTLENGFNDFALRVWLDYPMRPRQQVFFMTKNGDKFQSTMTEYRWYEKANDTFVFIKETKNRIPKHGWRKLLNFLEENGIYDLPDYRHLKFYGADLPSHAAGASFEVATREKYRLFRYPSPAVADFPEAKTVAKILKHLKDEMNLDIRGSQIVSN